MDVKCALKIQRREMKAGILREYLFEQMTFELDFKPWDLTFHLLIVIYSNTKSTTQK